MMTKADRRELESCVWKTFGCGLHEFILQKVEAECLCDYEIAEVLNINTWTARKYRKFFGIEKAKKFSRRFEKTYGVDAINRFKYIIEDPDKTLADAGRTFGFSREYARYVYKQIFGHPYTKTYRKKRIIRQRRRVVERMMRTKKIDELMKITDKLDLIGIGADIVSGPPSMISSNGYFIGIKIATKPMKIGKKLYFRFSNIRGIDKRIDFFICICREKPEDIHFIIPSGEMPKSVISLLPDAVPGKSKYGKFKEAWHQLTPYEPVEKIAVNVMR